MLLPPVVPEPLKEFREAVALRVPQVQTLSQIRKLAAQVYAAQARHLEAQLLGLHPRSLGQREYLRREHQQIQARAEQLQHQSRQLSHLADDYLQLVLEIHRYHCQIQKLDLQVQPQAVAMALGTLGYQEQQLQQHISQACQAQAPERESPTLPGLSPDHTEGLKQLLCQADRIRQDLRALQKDTYFALGQVEQFLAALN